MALLQESSIIDSLTTYSTGTMSSQMIAQESNDGILSWIWISEGNRTHPGYGDNPAPFELFWTLQHIKPNMT